MKDSKEKMDELEGRIMKFKAQNMGRLPEQFQSNVAQLQSLQMLLCNAQEALSRLQQPKMQLETQLQNTTTQMNYYNSMMEDQVRWAATRRVRNEKLNASTRHIVARRAAAAREKYTVNHPQIKKTQAQLASLEKQSRKQKRDLESQATVAAANTPQIQRRTKPAAVKMVQDYQNTNNTLKTDMQNINLQMDEKVKQAQQINAVSRHLPGASKAVRNWNSRIHR